MFLINYPMPNAMRHWKRRFSNGFRGLDGLMFLSLNSILQFILDYKIHFLLEKKMFKILSLKRILIFTLTCGTLFVMHRHCTTFPNCEYRYNEILQQLLSLNYIFSFFFIFMIITNLYILFKNDENEFIFEDEDEDESEGEHKGPDCILTKCWYN